MPLFFQNLTDSEIDKLNKMTSVIIFPIGILESFGPHLPINTGLQISECLALNLAKKLESEKPEYTVIIAPSIPFGIDSYSRQKAWSVRGHVIRDVISDFSKSYNKLGFKFIATISHQISPKQLTALEEAGRNFGLGAILNPGLKIFSLSSGLVDVNSFFASPFYPDPKEHGGKTDTSILLEINPGAVNPEYKSLVKITRPASRIRRWHQYLLQSSPPYWGDPSTAEQETGKKYLHDTTEILYSKLSLVLQGVSPQKCLRTWYSVLPINKSFFKGWLLAGGILILFTVWISLLLNGLLGTL